MLLPLLMNLGMLGDEEPAIVPRYHTLAVTLPARAEIGVKLVTRPSVQLRLPVRLELGVRMEGHR